MSENCVQINVSYSLIPRISVEFREIFAELCIIQYSEFLGYDATIDSGIEQRNNFVRNLGLQF